MHVRDVMRPIETPISGDASVQAAAERMRRDDVGCLMVGDRGQIEGIVTDRDLSIRCMAEGRNAAGTPVRDIMSIGVVSCQEHETVGEVVERMMELGLMRLPVFDGHGQLVGMISARDSVRSLPMSKVASKKPAVAQFFKDIPSSQGQMHRVPVQTVYVNDVETSEDAKERAIEHLRADHKVTDWSEVADGLEVQGAPDTPNPS